MFNVKVEELFTSTEIRGLNPIRPLLFKHTSTECNVLKRQT